jgi:hypothetical protein
MGIGVSLTLIAVGGVGLLLSLMFWSTWGAGVPGTRRRTTTTIDDAPPGN